MVLAETVAEGLVFAKSSTRVLDLAIARAKGVALAGTGAAGLGFAKSSTCMLDLAIPRMRRAAEGPWSSCVQLWWWSPRVCAMAVAVVV